MPLFKPEKSAHSDRGKAQEKEVYLFLEDISRQAHDFDFERLPDARSSMGRVAAQVADFAFFFPGGHGAIEVKCLAHNTRLAKAKVPQLAKLRKRHLAGGRCFIVTYHSTIGKWRCVQAHTLDPGAASWDLSAWPLHDSAAQALDGFADV